jgi:transposase
MGAKRRQFTPEFKLEAIRLAEQAGKPLSQVARELGIRPSMLRSWKRLSETRAGLTPGDVFPGNGKLSSQEEEIRRLRRELEQVKQERDFLKKATVYFAKESR